MADLNHEEEVQLIQRILNGEPEAYRLLVNQYQRYVFSVAYKIMGNEHDAEDVAQDAFLKAYRSLSRFKFDSKFSTWLYRITVNTAITQRRKKKFFTEDVQQIALPTEKNNQLKLSEQQHYIQLALKNLKEDDVVVITLFYLEELSLQEIAEITNEQENTVKVRLHRARKKLAEQLTLLLKNEAKELI